MVILQKMNFELEVVKRKRDALKITCNCMPKFNVKTFYDVIDNIKNICNSNQINFL